MAFDHRRRQPPIVPYTRDLLSFNPSTKGREGQSSFATAVAHPNNAARFEVNNGAFPFERHVRSRKEVHANRRASDGSLHPLRSAGLAPGSDDAGVTRPHLTRIVNVGTLVDAPPIPSDDTEEISSTPVEEMDVLVHEVCHVFLVSYH